MAVANVYLFTCANISQPSNRVGEYPTRRCIIKEVYHKSDGTFAHSQIWSDEGGVIPDIMTYIRFPKVKKACK